MSVPDSKADAFERVKALVNAFRRNEQAYTRPGSLYNETQVRTDFISPLLEAFGWDVYNTKRQPLDLREVFEEATVEVGEERLSKKPDYELRLARQRKFFVEAKKPSIRIDRDPAPSFQTRRYGFSASLPISVLTNFHQLSIYDCVPTPSESHPTTIARLKHYTYEQYISHFDELYAQISRDAVYSGLFDTTFNVGLSRHGANQFDDHFLAQVRSWRERLAINIHNRNPALSPGELTYAVHLFLCRIVFLRICEDRDLEKYETLKSLNNDSVYASLMQLIERADRFYDSGLFRILNDKRLGISIGDEVLGEIISELYYPQSPYTFSVVEAGVLGEIYEQFLGEVITFDDANNVVIVLKPEVRESGGVVPTPKYIVDAILDRTLTPAISGKSPSELEALTIADICCGSGIFLLGAFEHLLSYYAEWYSTHDREASRGMLIYEVAPDQWRLTLAEKRRILLQSIRGVDIDPNAVEVAKFSLLLKLIENETQESLKSYVAEHKTPALPCLDGIIRQGNSLISHEEYTKHLAVPKQDSLEAISPFTWTTEFPNELSRGGFNIMVGNPPYIRIQNMVEYSPEEVAFFKSTDSPYVTSRSDNFDKYSLFIERYLSLLASAGRLGVIVPHKFMITTAGASVRRLLTENGLLEGLVHFGSQQVFGRYTSNYTCIISVAKNSTSEVSIEQVPDLTRWRYGEHGQKRSYPKSHFGIEPWTIADRSAQAIFDRIKSKFSDTLGSVSDIFVGVQTSADPIYILEPESETSTHVMVSKNGQQWKIEREILRPCLHDVQLEAYSTPAPNKYMIFPYRIGRRAMLIQPSDMRADFPGAWAYLNANKGELEKRSITGGEDGTRQFYQFGRSQSLTKFNSPKIILPILSLEPRYAFDDANIVVTGGGNGPYYLIRQKPEATYPLLYLMAVLCHPLSEAMIRTRTSVFRGGYYSHGKQFIEVLPVPSASEHEMVQIEQLVRNAITAYDAVQLAKTPALRNQSLRLATATKQQIEESVSMLFGLSKMDMEIINSVPVPS